MKNKALNSTGFTLIELVVVLSVILILVAILVPSMGNFATDANFLKVERDLKTIGLTIIRMKSDVGHSCIKRNSDLKCTKSNRVDLLAGDGPDVVASDVLSADFSSAEMQSATVNWDDDGSTNASMRDQFVLNMPSYPIPRENINNQPGSFRILGWRGVYISPPIGPDPWGRKYLINSVFLEVASDSASGNGEGQRPGGWSYDVFVISAGSNGLYETLFAQEGAVASGDDMIFVVAGDTR